MGRCYEFGVVIEDGCDHAMVVSPEGGACVCGTCGTSCTGRFSGCAAILAIPGHVPIAAPKGSLDVERKPPGVPLRPVPAAVTETAPQLEMPAIPAEVASRNEAAVAPVDDAPKLAEVLDLFEELLSRPDRAMEVVAQLRHELAQRDEELIEAFDRLTDAHLRIADELAVDRTARQQIADAIGLFADRLDALEQAASAAKGQGPTSQSGLTDRFA